MMRYLLLCSVRVALLAVLTYLSAASTLAQANAAGTAPSGQPSPGLLPVAIKIAPGDLLEISVFDVPELTQQVRVAADGTAQLALIGSLTLGGLTAQEAAEKIAHELRDRKLLLSPQVNLLIKEYSSQGVSVMGEVQHPGIYQILGPRTLLDVISMAGGLTNAADTRITIKRRTGDEQNIVVKLKNDDVRTSIANDVQVYPGDLVMVARAGIVYVLGDVNRPGGFVMQDNGQITLLQALAQAGGATQSAALNKALVLHKSGSTYVSSKARVGRIARGQDEDFPLQANDILFVPNSRLKNAVHNTQAVAQTLGAASIYAIVH